MPLRTWIAAAGTAALFAALALAGPSCADRPAPRNLLVITLDTMRADRLPPWGATDVATPSLDRLAAGGTLFEQAFASVPLTLPSHATLFTGLQPYRLGVRDNAGAPLATEFTTLAELLGGRGLRTGAVIASAVLAPGRGLEQGFDSYDMAQRKGCGPGGGRRTAGEAVDAAIAWLGGGDGRPFFLWLHLFDTHLPYRVPAEYTRSHRDGYAAAIAYQDAQIARVLDALEALGRLEDTLIVIAGDHGESLGDHGENAHGIFVYQPTLHVPLILHGPGIPDARVREVVRLVDVTPTLAELFGAAAPDGLDGRSLGPLLAGSVEAEGREVYAESLYPLRFGWAPLRSLRADRYKLIDAPRAELYDLGRDPLERTNLAEARPHLVYAMRARLHALDGSGDEERPSPATPDVAARLASLGYSSGGAAPAPAGTPSAMPDPKDHIGVYNEITSRQLGTAAGMLAGCASPPDRP